MGRLNDRFIKSFLVIEELPLFGLICADPSDHGAVIDDGGRPRRVEQTQEVSSLHEMR
jgi:hypothetical protein